MLQIPPMLIPRVFFTFKSWVSSTKNDTLFATFGSLKVKEEFPSKCRLSEKMKRLFCGIASVCLVSSDTVMQEGTEIPHGYRSNIMG